MQNLLTERLDAILFITFNRIDKHNAFDDVFLMELQTLLDEARDDDTIRVLVLNGLGKHFSAGADLSWMKRMAHFSEEENLKDAHILARLMHTLHQHPKPTIAMVHGKTFGGGVGIIAACDIAIAADTASFCFSEVKLGLIPAVISPYVIRAIGARASTWLFMSAEIIDAKRAYELNLIQYCVTKEHLRAATIALAQQLASLPPNAVVEAKSLVSAVVGKPIDEKLQEMTASLIAKKRVSLEGQQKLQAFLNKCE